MAKGHEAHRERQELVASLGKGLAKRAGFVCEWCASKEDLRPWDRRPQEEPRPETLALLCVRCRELAAGKTPQGGELHALRNALWSDVPAVAEGAAAVLLRTGEGWVREAVEESLISEEAKRELLEG
ncbi:MAG TPA: hypothetical protein VNX25_03935 [Verrucomicrobiae bacterium]|nr:hypothetical protein [Verrucomicrobiae bacterium]